MGPRDDSHEAELATMREASVSVEARLAQLERDYLEMGIEIQNLIAMLRIAVHKEP